MLLVACSSLAFADPFEKSSGPNSLPGPELFAESPVRQLELEIDSQGLKSLANEARQFVRAKVREADATYPDVAVHLKGSVGSFRPVNDKPGFTLDFARFRENQRFHGLRRIHLNNSVEDPSYCNEVLGSEIFRAAGIPSPRVTRATVILNGRKLGLYVLQEGFTEDFLSGYFHTVGGSLFEPGEGHDVNEHLKKSSGRGAASGRKTLKALAQAALDSDVQHRWDRISGVLETDHFTKFMALEVMLCHRDGYCLARNNFRVYENVDTGKMVFLPQGMDQLFGVPELPWMPHMAGLVARGVLETPQGKQGYTDVSKELLDRLLQLSQLTNRVHQLVTALRPVVAESEFENIENSAHELTGRIIKRRQFLEVQLSNGHFRVPEFSNGVACLTNWTKADEPVSGRLRIGLSPDGLSCLEIMTQEEACPSWHTRALLDPGRYRFEGNVRVTAVNPVGFGTHQGAGLRVAGNVRQSSDMIGTTQWQKLTAAFEVPGAAREVEFICELRAKSGEAWFDVGSLCVVKEP
jgi:hypothetical protein